jgi:glycosyltransferase involved in cell wall biosynthesis
MGGASTFVLNLTAELVRRKIPTEVYSFDDDNGLTAEFAQARVPVFCQDGKRHIFEDRLLAILRRMAQFLPSVVIANIGTTSFETLRYMPQGIFRCGVVHADLQSVYDSVRVYARFMDSMAVVSQTIREKLREMPDFANVPVTYLPLGVPMPERVSPKSFSDPLRILYLGRIAREQKRVHLFPQILEDLSRTGMPFHWTIAGEGPESSWLRDALRSARQDQTVEQLGFVPYADVPALIDRHDVFLLASDYEGLPLTLLEAMGHGLVPIVSDLASGVRDVVNDSNGCRVALENVGGYAAAIHRLHQDRDLTATLSANARAAAYPFFSTAGMADRWLASFPKPGAGVEWPKRWRVQSRMGAPNNYRSWGIMYGLRRLFKRLNRASRKATPVN